MDNGQAAAGTDGKEFVDEFRQGARFRVARGGARHAPGAGGFASWAMAVLAGTVLECLGRSDEHGGGLCAAALVK